METCMHTLVQMWLCTYIPTYTFLHVCLHKTYMHTTYMYVCIDTYMHACMHSDIPSSLQTYIHIIVTHVKLRGISAILVTSSN